MASAPFEKQARMDERTVVNAGAAALVAALLVIAYLIRFDFARRSGRWRNFLEAISTATCRLTNLRGE